jgi:hypothetical protein
MKKELEEDPEYLMNPNLKRMLTPKRKKIVSDKRKLSEWNYGVIMKNFSVPPLRLLNIIITTTLTRSHDRCRLLVLVLGVDKDMALLLVV